MFNSLFKSKTTLELDSIAEHCSRSVAKLQQLRDSLADIGDQTHHSNKTFLSSQYYLTTVYLPLIDGFILCYNTLSETNEQLTPQAFSETKIRKLNAFFIRKRLNRLSRLLNKTSVKKQTIVSNFLYKWSVRSQKRLESRWQKINNILTSHPDIFSELDAIMGYLEQGVETIQSEEAWNADSHSFSCETLNLEWIIGLKNAKKKRNWNHWQMTKSQIHNLANKSSNQLIFTQLEPTIFNTLAYEDGWDQSALNALRLYLLNNCPANSVDTQSYLWDILLNERKKVGSPTYLVLFKNSAYTPFKKLELLLQHLGAEIDEFDMLQLKGPFTIDTNLAPHSYFIELVAKTVQEAYPDGDLDSMKLHQLRMYFDKQNIEYVRENFPNTSDEASLMDYVYADAPEGLGGKLLIKERGRFHNKIPDGQVYRDYILQYANRKRLTPNFHSEFILDRNGCFISQWNKLKVNGNHVISDPKFYTFTEEFERQLLDSESLNYGRKNDAEHERLDSNPPLVLDHKIRVQCKKNWYSPSTSDYSFKEIDPGDSYSK